MFFKITFVQVSANSNTVQVSNLSSKVQRETVCLVEWDKFGIRTLFNCINKPGKNEP